jgi:hypothetical protein
MTTGLTYSDYVTQIATLTVVDPTDPNFQIILPQAITYSENRMCRDLDFLSTVTTNTSYALTAGNRKVSVPASQFVTIQEVNVITPAGAVNPDTNTRQALIPTTKEFLDVVYNSVAGNSVPSYFAMLDQSTFIVGPWPDNNYNLEIVGTIRPASLSASNPTTFISLYLPDLMIMASMIYISGYQRNFGRQSDDPAMAQSYEGQYQTLLKGAMVEEARKKFQAGGWTSMSPAVVASPTRG